jgi:pantoate kinase
VTGIFAPDVSARDPRARGSRGAGIVLELGVLATARWDPRGPRRTIVGADVAGPLPISNDVAKRLVADRKGTVTVRLTHQLPVGQGFGMSAAGALATGLAVAGLFGIPRQRAVDVAHLADLFGGGGLGGVAAILGGGLEYRETPGVPPFGRILHRPFPRALIVGVVGGPLPSPRVLRDERVLRRIASAAAGFSAGSKVSTVPGFLNASERFTDEVRLTTPRLRRVLRAIRDDGGWAAQAMFGRSFFAVPRSAVHRRAILATLERDGTRAIEVRARNRGAARLREARP